MRKINDGLTEGQRYYRRHKDDPEFQKKKKISRKKDYQKHKDKYKANAKKWREENPERCKENAQEYFREHREEDKARHKKCRAKNNKMYKARERENRQKLRQKVLLGYGNQCACCGETIDEFLQIDHINGSGRKHKREVAKGKTHLFYAWLIKNNFPEGFQVLCANCNIGKYRNNGICPHKNKHIKIA